MTTQSRNTEPDAEVDESAFEPFEEFTQKLLAVPKREIDAARAKAKKP